jgi:hypothetical protein
MQELWLPVVGYEGLYEVSDCGRVRSLPHTVWHTKNRYGVGSLMRKPGKLLRQSRCGMYGYLGVALHKDYKQKTLLTHKLVADAFLGPRPEGLVVMHGEAGKQCNVLANLSYGTYSQNSRDRVRDGTHDRGERNGRAKLTEAQVLQIYTAALSASFTREDLAKEHNCTEHSVKSIRSGRSWRWLTRAESTSPRP